tara:strand:- start:489 stop:620 length:132 start_codon:yes stop_codon:yes gene_type:complete
MKFNIRIFTNGKYIFDVIDEIIVDVFLERCVFLEIDDSFMLLF